MLDQNKDPSIDHAMAALRSRFLDTLDHRILEIENAALACRAKHTASSYQRLAHHIHKTAGVAASFGFTEVGARAQSIDVMIDQLLSDPSQRACASRVLTDVEMLLEQMETLLDHSPV